MCEMSKLGTTNLRKLIHLQIGITEENRFSTIGLKYINELIPLNWELLI